MSGGEHGACNGALEVSYLFVGNALYLSLGCFHSYA